MSYDDGVEKQIVEDLRQREKAASEAVSGIEADTLKYIREHADAIERQVPAYLDASYLMDTRWKQLKMPLAHAAAARAYAEGLRRRDEYTALVHPQHRRRADALEAHWQKMREEANTLKRHLPTLRGNPLLHEQLEQVLYEARFADETNREIDRVRSSYSNNLRHPAVLEAYAKHARALQRLDGTYKEYESHLTLENPAIS